MCGYRGVDRQGGDRRPERRQDRLGGDPCFPWEDGRGINKSSSSDLPSVLARSLSIAVLGVSENMSTLTVVLVEAFLAPLAAAPVLVCILSSSARARWIGRLRQSKASGFHSLAVYQ